MINIRIRNLDTLKQLISEMPRGVRGAATEGAAKALIGNERTGLQHYPGRKQHGEGNPYQWQSEKQRRAYFATNGFGRGIPSPRSYDLRFGWKVSAWGDGTKMRVQNDVPYAGFVMGDQLQTGHKVDGWRAYQQVISDNMNAMLLAADQALNRYLKSKGW